MMRLLKSRDARRALAGAVLRISRTARLALAVILFLIPRAAAACPVCFGDPNSSQTKGQNAAILFLLGVTALVMGGFVGTVLRIRRRNRKLQEAAAE